MREHPTDAVATDDASVESIGELFLRWRDQCAELPEGGGLDSAARAETTKLAGRWIELATPILHRTSFCICRSETDADEATAESFLRILVKARSFRGECPVIAWMKRIAAHTTLRVLRSRRLERKAAETWAALTSSVLSDRLASKADQEAILKEALALLPPQARATLELVVSEGMSREQAAALLDIAPGTVHWQVNRAKERIREHFARRGRVLAAAPLVRLLRERPVPPPRPELTARLLAQASRLPSGAGALVPLSVLGGVLVVFVGALGLATGGPAPVLGLGASAAETAPSRARRPPATIEHLRVADAVRRATLFPAASLPPASVVMGRVVTSPSENEAIEPVAGAIVEVTFARSEVPETLTGVTDRAGLYSITLPEGVDFLRVVARTTDGFLTGKSTPRMPYAMPILFGLTTGSITMEDLSLRAGVRVSGAVVDAEDRPVPGFLVFADRIDGLFGDWTECGADGSFEFPSLRPGKYRFRADSGSVMTETVHVTIAAGSPASRIRVPAGPLEERVARVVSSAGAPFASALVRRAASGLNALPFAVTDPDGRFRFLARPGSELPIRIVHPDAHSGRLLVSKGAEPGTSETFTLEPQPPLEILVSDRDSGAPLDGASVTIRSLEGRVVRAADPAGSGLYSLAMGFDGRSSAYRRLVVAAPGFETRVQKMPTPQNERRIHVELGPEARISGTVRDEVGAPLAFAQVHVVEESGAVLRRVRATAEGAYEISGVGAGSYQLVAAVPDRHPSAQWISVLQRDEVVGVDPTIPLPGIVRIRCDDSEIGAVCVTLMATFEAGESVPPLVAHVMEPGEVWTIPPFPGGELTIVSNRSETSQLQSPIVQTVQVAPGGEADVLLTLQPTGSARIAVEPKDLPLGAIEVVGVSMNGASSLSGVLQEDGAFLFPRVPAGERWVFAVVARGLSERLGLAALQLPKQVLDRLEQHAEIKGSAAILLIEADGRAEATIAGSVATAWIDLAALPERAGWVLRIDSGAIVPFGEAPWHEIRLDALAPDRIAVPPGPYRIQIRDGSQVVAEWKDGFAEVGAPLVVPAPETAR